MSSVPPFRPFSDLASDSKGDPSGVGPAGGDVARDARGVPLPAEDGRHALAVDTPESIADDLAHTPDGRLDHFRRFRLPGAVAVLGLTAFALLVASRSDLRAAPPQGLVPADAAARLAPPAPPAADEAYTFAGLDIHPDRLHRDYFAGAFTGDAVRSPSGADFLWRLNMYRRAYGEDGNLTIRVYDDRDGRMLDVESVPDLGTTDWDAVNLQRRALSEAMRVKWTGRGIPREALTIRWGYRHQTDEARARDARYIAYEVNLARRLGLSLLATEIGTVETFNQDKLVSSAGARSRYQMMPDILRMFDVEQYALPVASGGTIEVKEEWHPLLAMEPSLMLVRAYSNAVGHELPGISAYHTGPGNLFALYREFMRAHPGMRHVRGGHVSDAYMWGVTDGFARVDAVSSFGAQSRVYVLKAYGALRATEDELVDPSASFRGERVRLQTGAGIALSDLLETLAPHERRLDWGPADEGSLYARFREMNPHLALPVAAGDDVPAVGDVRLTASAGGVPVRFFLPLGATDVLRRVGRDIVAESLPFDGTTFLVGEAERTSTDRAYDALVEDVGRFGFTRANQGRLLVLHDRMQELAAADPQSRYRQTQAKIIRIHASIWRTSGFRDLVATTETLFSVNPLVQMGRQPLASADSALPPAARPASPRAPIAPVAPMPPRIEDTVRY